MYFLDKIKLTIIRVIIHINFIFIFVNNLGSYKSDKTNTNSCIFDNFIKKGRFYYSFYKYFLP